MPESSTAEPPAVLVSSMNGLLLRERIEELRVLLPVQFSEKR
jgi:hypothetical protein